MKQSITQQSIREGCVIRAAAAAVEKGGEAEEEEATAGARANLNVEHAAGRGLACRRVHALVQGGCGRERGRGMGMSGGAPPPATAFFHFSPHRRRARA